MNSSLFASVQGLIPRSEVTRTDLQRIFEKGITVEQLLQGLVDQDGFLLHGSTALIEPHQPLQTNEHGVVFFTNNAAIAILKALFSNRLANLRYPMRINDDHPMHLLIQDASIECACVGCGFVYVVRPPGEILNDPPGTWQYTYSKSVPYILRIEIRRDDFTYPVRAI